LRHGDFGVPLCLISGFTEEIDIDSDAKGIWTMLRICMYMCVWHL